MVVAMSDVKPMTASVGASTTSAATPTMAPRPPMDTTTKGNPTLKKDMTTNNNSPSGQTSRGTKRRSSMPDATKTKMPCPQPPLKQQSWDE
ncbi:hypothetical protein V6N12_058417 [Hibiscus sabdariffa]|uniref:Uncharacterized protein n=1 Tax=Hibiscus sabdariffa TaxID=183260 RepID=A0ABR2ES63_9ROSI